MTTDLYALLLRIQEHLDARDAEPGQANELRVDVAVALLELRSQLGPFAELRTEPPQERQP